MQGGPRANPYAGLVRKISPQILCGAGQPALPPLAESVVWALWAALDVSAQWEELVVWAKVHWCWKAFQG